MAVTSFDFRVSTRAPIVDLHQNPNEYKGLFDRADFSDTKPKKLPTIIKTETLEDKPQTLELPAIRDGYVELMEKAEDLLGVLKDRVGDLTYTFVPEDKPSLSQAVADTFEGMRDRITYGMYLAALKLEKEIALALGEASNVTT